VAENVEEPSEWVGERIRAYMDPPRKCRAFSRRSPITASSSTSEHAGGKVHASTPGRWSGGFILSIGRLSMRITRRFLSIQARCILLRHVSSPASRTLRVGAERNTPPTEPMTAYPTSIAPVMRPAPLRLVDAQTPTQRPSPARHTGLQTTLTREVSLETRVPVAH